MLSLDRGRSTCPAVTSFPDGQMEDDDDPPTTQALKVSDSDIEAGFMQYRQYRGGFCDGDGDGDGDGDRPYIPGLGDNEYAEAYDSYL